MLEEGAGGDGAEGKRDGIYDEKRTDLDAAHGSFSLMGDESEKKYEEKRNGTGDNVSDVAQVRQWAGR